LNQIKQGTNQTNRDKSFDHTITKNDMVRFEDPGINGSQFALRTHCEHRIQWTGYSE